MESYIYLNQVSIYAYHGVSPQETRVGNTFLIDLKLKTDISQAIESDDITHTVSYADIYRLLTEEMAVPSKLLEHVAGRIVRRIFQDFPTIETVTIKLSKQNPPMGADIAFAGVELTANR
ncbi:dihydroneopterin aldolase [Bacteroides sp. 51]|uniref:dihydroneopterin aldolase n=1 Tax=Bacteroides sp. 51 TaxID=2302938 RepID=UPI0013D2F575|nr:dihydroneopterin aldolase [Bacteroides sp. 51]NDV81155.1 dihydroneopterin aldolase [Bacteroides sp. 51]